MEKDEIMVLLKKIELEEATDLDYKRLRKLLASQSINLDILTKNLFNKQLH